jgi:hypothetical protein
MRQWRIEAAQAVITAQLGVISKHAPTSDRVNAALVEIARQQRHIERLNSGDGEAL